jgi:hypothetical protein
MSFKAKESIFIMIWNSIFTCSVIGDPACKNVFFEKKEFRETKKVNKDL